ncbi:MAG: type secretion system domain, type pilus assembly protein PilC [Parcubacteria group bacterium]|nr:type secretion system domain, type pilus assembly protein PilC [Parcubacteria group bacterium]
MNKLFRTSDPRRMRIRSDERILFAKRLALYLRSGIPIVQALALMVEDTKTGNHITLLRAVTTEVTQGRTLSQALGAFPKAYTAFHTNLIAVGEASGTLADNLNYLAQLLERKAHLNRKIVSALVYPAIIMLGTLAVSGFLVLYAFPKMIPLFRGFHATLPFTTRVLIGISDLIARHGLLLLLGFALIVASLVFFLRKPRIRRCLQFINIRIPLIASLTTFYYLSAIHRTLALLLESGMRIEASLLLAGDGLANAPYKESLEHIRRSIVEGNLVSVAMRTEQRLYPAIVTQLVSAGEKTGNLKESFKTIADIYEDHLDELTRTLSTLVEPALMLVMGLIVGFVALAIITPIYGLTQNITVH